MKVYSYIATMVAATLLLSETGNATPAIAGMYAGYTTTKTVRFHLRNDMSQELRIKVGEDAMTLQPGKPIALKLRIGEKVISVQASPSYATGAVIVVGAPELSNATIVLH